MQYFFFLDIAFVWTYLNRLLIAASQLFMKLHGLSNCVIVPKPFIFRIVRPKKVIIKKSYNWTETTSIRMVTSCDIFKTRDSWAPSQYPKRRLSVRSSKVSKPRDWYFKLSYRFGIWQAHRQHCCRSACQISERSDNSKYKSRGFETLRDLTERRLFGYWDGAQVL